MNGAELSYALTHGDCVYGTAVLSPSPLWPKAVSTLDLDFVFIDTEHTPLDRETVSWMCLMYQAYRIAPLVRIPSPDPYLACMVLDGGAAGVIAPYVETAEQVRQLAGAVKHRPLKGMKLQNHLGGKERYDGMLSDYIHANNKDRVLIINLESGAAIENIDEIMSVSGLDAVLIGPHDLTCSLGVPEQYQHPKFLRAVETILSHAMTKSIGVGVHVWDAVGYDQEILWAKKGMNLILHSNDLLLFRNTLQKDFEKIREAIEQVEEPPKG